MTRYTIILILLLASCKREKISPPTQKPPEYYNTVFEIRKWPAPDSIVVHYRVYTSQADFMRGTNPFISADTDTTIYINGLTHTESLYYVDIYSDNYQYTNWPQFGRSTQGSPVLTFHEFLSGIWRTGKAAPVGELRAVLLNGDDSVTRWQAVNLINAGGFSYWNNLDEYMRYQKLELRKDRKFTFTYKTPDDAIVTDTGTFVTGKENETYSTTDFTLIGSSVRQLSLKRGLGSDSSIIAKDTIIMNKFGSTNWIFARER